MGHLTKIANHLADSTEKGNNSERIKKCIQGKVPAEGGRLQWACQYCQPLMALIQFALYYFVHSIPIIFIHNFRDNGTKILENLLY